MHLSDESGAIIAELAPTWPRSLTPGEKLYVSLLSVIRLFAGWSPHAAGRRWRTRWGGRSESHAGGRKARKAAEGGDKAGEAEGK